MPTLKGTEASLSYVQYLISCTSSINVSIFPITWLDTFWTDLIRNFQAKNQVKGELRELITALKLLGLGFFSSWAHGLKEPLYGDVPTR